MKFSKLVVKYQTGKPGTRAGFFVWVMTGARNFSPAEQ